MGEHMVVIGLTGPTGAGKSTIAGFFQKLGCECLDCDRIAREVTDRPACTAALCEAFGERIAPGGRLNRRVLADVAFAAPGGVQVLNQITHPLIIAEIRARLQLLRGRGARASLIDAPLLFEGGVDALCDCTLAVTAGRALRLRRIMARDGIGEAAASARMAAQPPDEYYRIRATYELDGGRDPGVLQREVERLYREILTKYTEENRMTGIDTGKAGDV